MLGGIVQGLEEWIVNVDHVWPYFLAFEGQMQHGLRAVLSGGRVGGCRAPQILTREELDAAKAEMKAIDARPIKKVLEAKARKQKRLRVRSSFTSVPFQPADCPRLQVQKPPRSANTFYGALLISLLDMFASGVPQLISTSMCVHRVRSPYDIQPTPLPLFMASVKTGLT